MSKIFRSTQALKISKLGKENALPNFTFLREQAAAERRMLSASFSEDFTEEQRENMSSENATPLLPYLTLDSYDRSQEEGVLDVAVLENSKLKAIFYPQYGGRLASLFYKEDNRELLFKNPVFQPSNLAIRNAWYSGGVEWNGPLYGHSLLTCSPVYTGLVETSKGPLLRIFEFDRALETTWQVDVFLPEDEDKLFVHVKLRNLNEQDIRYYWWSNISVPCTKHTRVLSPNTGSCIRHTPENKILKIPFPDFAGFDGSYIRNYPSADSIFFDKPEGVRPFISSVEEDGKGFMHTSTNELFGRKLWTWGNNTGGRRWMDFLSLENQGDYIEIQAGLTQTQMETLPMDGNACLEWTEVYMPWEMDKKDAFQEDVQKANQCALDVLDDRLPEEDVNAMHHFLKGTTEIPIKENLFYGEAWGALYEKRCGRKISEGLLFDAPIGEKEKIWQELIEIGNFKDLDTVPEIISWQVRPSWIKHIKASAEKEGMSWLHALLLGTAALEHKEFEEAEPYLLQSIEKKETYFAYRNLALIQDKKGNLKEAGDYYQQAWDVSNSALNLGIEIAEYLLKRDLQDRLAKFLEASPAELRSHERVQLVYAKLAFERKDYEKVLKILEHEFVTIREGETVLTDLWFDTHIKMEERKRGKELSDEEAVLVRQKTPAPRSIDFRMAQKNY